MKRHSISSMILSAVLLVGAAGTAFPATIQFTNVVNGGNYDYLTTTNWFGGAVPTQADTAFFTNDNTYTVTFSGVGNAGNVNFNARNGGSVTFDIGAGNLWGVATEFDVGNNNNTTNWVMITSGTVTSRIINVGSLSTSVGTLVINGASMISTGNVGSYIGRNGAGSVVISNNGTLMLGGCTMVNSLSNDCAGTLTIGANGTFIITNNVGTPATTVLQMGGLNTTSNQTNSGYVWLTDNTSTMRCVYDINLGNFGVGGINAIMVVSNGTVSARNIYIQKGSLTIQNGTVNNTGTLRAGGSANGTLTINGGALNIGTLVIANGANSTGTVIVTGGTLTTGNTTNNPVGAFIGPILMGGAAGSVARLNISGGTVNAGTNLVACANANSSVGTITLSGTGKLTAGRLQIGYGTGANTTGTIWVTDSATLIATNTPTNDGACVLGVTNSVSATMVISNGTVRFTSMNIGPAGQGTLSMYGGQLTVDRLLVTNGVNSVITLGGGQLSAIDITNTASALIVGDGNTSVVATQTLLGGNALFTGGLIITNDGVLTGTGTIAANVIVTDGGVLAPGSSPGLLTVNGNLALGSFSVLNYDLGTSSDSVTVNGDLALGGTVNVTSNAGFTATTYTLFTHTNVVSGSLAVGTLPPGYSAVVSNDLPNTARILLVVSAVVSDSYQTWASHYGLAGGNALGTADPDGDGIINTNEFLAGFNPTNSAAYAHVISIATTAGTNMTVTYLGASGDSTYTGGPASRANVLEFTTGTPPSYTNNFVSTGQTNVLSGGSGLGGVASFVDTNGASGPARYYRVRVLAP